MRKFIEKQIAEFDGWTNAGSAADAVLYQDGNYHIEQIEQQALELGYPKVVEACQKPGYGVKHTRQVLAACLAACPEPTKQVYSLAEAAEYLGYSDSGLRKIKDRGEIRFSQNGQGPIKFQREWLDEFLQNRRQVDRSPVQKQRAPISIEPEHGFDPSLLQADAQSGSE